MKNDHFWLSRGVGEKDQSRFPKYSTFGLVLTGSLGFGISGNGETLSNKTQAWCRNGSKKKKRLF